jgi:hypothetical protein
MNPVYSLPLDLFKTNFYMVAGELILRGGEVRGESYDTQTQQFSKL